MDVTAGRNLNASSVTDSFSVSDDGQCVVDLSNAHFVDPVGLVVVGSLVERSLRDDIEPVMRLPRSQEARSYLARMHLGTEMSRIGFDGCSLAPVTENALGDRLLELHQFDGDGSEALAERVHSIFAPQDPAEAADLWRSVAEAMANVCDHSGVGGGWAALQQYGSGSNTTVRFAVADCGVGLQSTLARVYDVPDPQSAIELALQKGTTSTGKIGRGLGLYGIAERALKRSGKLQIWSSAAIGSMLPKGSFRTRGLDVSYPGTIVYATLALKSRR